nr:hypothetical protein [Clostridium sp.]
MKKVCFVISVGEKILNKEEINNSTNVEVIDEDEIYDDTSKKREKKKINKKFLIVIAFIVMLVGVVGSSAIISNLKQNEFTTKLGQCKEIIEDTDTIISPEQTKFIEKFVNKYSVNDSYYYTQFLDQFVTYFKIKMEEGLAFNDADDINKLIVVSQLGELNSNKEIEDLRLKLSPSPYIEETLSESTQSSEPYIGMSEDDLRKCVWGSPKDVNTTTTAYKISKQFCYTGNRYVYVEGGVVTSIQN